MEREELLRLFISLDFVTINPVVIIGYTIIILGGSIMTKTDNIYGVFDGSWALLTAGTEEKYNTMTNL